MAETRIDLGSLSFNTGASIGGATWWADELSGWGGPEVRRSAFDRVGAPGRILTESDYGPRVLVLEGEVITPTEAIHWAARETLMAACGVAADVWLAVYETTPKQVKVRRSGELIIKPTFTASFRFSFPLVADDPRKFTLAQTALALV